MTSLHGTRLRSRRLVIAVAAVLAVLAVAAAPAGAAKEAPAPAEMLSAASLVGFDRDSDAASGRQTPVATSGNFLLRNSVFTPLEDVPGAGRTTHTAINNRGQTVGTYDDGAGPPFRGFLRDRRGRFTRFDVPGASSTLPLGINDQGHVVGFYADSGGPDGVGGSGGW